jgi:hypothetical protein
MRQLKVLFLQMAASVNTNQTNHYLRCPNSQANQFGPIVPKFLQYIITTLRLKHRVGLRNQTWFQNLTCARFSTCAPAVLISCLAWSAANWAFSTTNLSRAIISNYGEAPESDMTITFL